MLTALFVALLGTPDQAKISTALWNPSPHVLIMSKTAGFRHSSIETGVAAFRALASKSGFTVDHTEDSSLFTKSNLAKYDSIIMLCTTGDIFNDSQQEAFKDYIEQGGGLVGIHAATDTEKDWAWYVDTIGGHFHSHPEIQKATTKIEDRAHPTTAGLPTSWIRTDEWYNFIKNPRQIVRVLGSLDESSYKGGNMNGDHPIIWSNEVGKGRIWYTGMGHTDETYSDQLFLNSVSEAVLWTSQAGRPKNGQNIAFKNESKWKSASRITVSDNKFVTQEGFGEIANIGTNEHLVSSSSHGDCFVHLEFMMPKGSNSGVYLQGRYEIQILDIFGKADSELTYDASGGIYQRWKDNRGYEGRAPLTNALRPAGNWNTLDIRFNAPRFNASGKKTENAKFLEVRLNGVVVQRNQEVTGPTRAAMFEDEKATGPLMLQGDHGPMAFRNAWMLKL